MSTASQTMPNPTLASAAALLRSAGWIVLPPPEKLPPIAVGQVWQPQGTNFRTRTITAVGADRWRGHYRYRTSRGESWWQRDKQFYNWARKSGARPAPPPP